MELREIIKQRHSVRLYTEQPVERKLIEQLILSASQAPTSCNLQLNQFIIVDDAKLLKKLTESVSGKFGIAPCIIILVYDPRLTIERQSAVTSLGMAAENILLTAIDLGLAACPMAGFDKDDQIKAILNIPKHLAVGLMITVGYEKDSGQFFRVPKLPLDKTFSYNQYNALPLLNTSGRLKDHDLVSLAAYRSRIAPVYLDRYRLNTYRQEYYQSIVDYLAQYFNSSAMPQTWLDILTYDGCFIKLLKADDRFKPIQLTASDIIVESLSRHEKVIGCKTALIDSNYQIPSGAELVYDCVSCIFQLEFIPQPKKIFALANKSLISNGLLMVAVVHQSMIKRWQNIWRKFWQKFIRQRTVNIYENNIFYRLGPRQEIFSGRLSKLARKQGFDLMFSRKVTASQAEQVSVYFFQKSAKNN